VVAFSLATASAKVAGHGSPKRPERALLKHYKVFGRARSADVPSDAQIVNAGVVTRFQLNVGNTQLVQTDAGPVWIVPGSNGACVLSGAATATAVPQYGDNFVGCSDASSMLQTALTVQAYSRGGGAFVFGLVPDGNGSVTVTSAGQSTVIPVVDNTFKASVPAGNVTISYTGAAGTADKTSFARVR